MRIDVLNGVNLNLLGRRDQSIYGSQSIQDLETQIYAWARELDLQVRCRQTNNEGEYVGFLHQALGTADGLVVNPGAWTHYSWAIHDALEPFEVPFVEVHLSNVDEREEWRRHSVLSGLGGLRIVGKGFDGYREALGLLNERRQSMTRLARLAASLSEPLLVTDATNVRYLTGFESSNSALLVEPEGTTTLYTDFRYLEAARAIEDVDVSQTQRDVAGALAEILAGKRVGFEALQISYLQWEKIGSAAPSSCPRRGSSRRSGGSRTRASSTRSAARRRSSMPSTRPSRTSRSSAAPRSTSPGGSSGRCASTGRRRSPSTRSSPPA